MIESQAEFAVRLFCGRGSLIVLVALLISGRAMPSAAAEEPPASESPTKPSDEALANVSRDIEVQPAAADEEIASRLRRILNATKWFEGPEVHVDQGIVFLSGRADSEQHKQWASTLAGNIQDVVAVVNRFQVAEKSMWDLTPAWEELHELTADAVRSSPLIGISLLLLVASWYASKWSARGTSRFLRGRLRSDLLRNVVGRSVAIPVFLLGLYLVLKVSGLTRLAMTVVGGTGLIGLVIGFAFRDIAENFLASVLISMQHPFASGDLIEVAGYRGFVQSVNTRSTLLMTLEGNHVQIPNATIYKDTITNFTANPNARFDFVVGIGYDDSLAEAQAVALSVLRDHPAVVDDPEPLVLVEALGAATVNLRVYFWVDIATYSPLKVCSAVIRLTKLAFEEADISMPDEAREVVFPTGVPVHIQSDEPVKDGQRGHRHIAKTEADQQPANSAEGDLASEASEIQHQARQARTPEAGQNLLES